MVIQLLLPDYCTIDRLIKSGSADIVSSINPVTVNVSFFALILI